MSPGLLADGVVVLHFAFVVFVVAGGLLALRWLWIAWVHIPAALWGAVVELLGLVCPLTPLEVALRERAGERGYAGGFVEEYLLPVLYPGALTPAVQVTLGVAVVMINIAVYGLVISRRRRRDPPRGRA